MTTIAPALLAGLLLLSPPDILPDGMRGIRVESRIDAKALAAEHCLGYVLQKGDTLAALARTHLGDEARWPEIEKLNPMIEANRLRPGELVWLPPRDAAAARKELVFAYLHTGLPFHDSAKPLVDAATFEPSRYGGFGVLLVPASSRSTFREAIEALAKDRTATRGQTLQALIANGKVSRIDGKSPGRLVFTNDPTEKRSDTYLVEKDQGGKFVLRVTSIAYDKDGKAIERAGGTGGEQGEQGLLLLLLAAAGGGFLLHRARRHQGPQPAIA